MQTSLHSKHLTLFAIKNLHAKNNTIVVLVMVCEALYMAGLGSNKTPIIIILGNIYLVYYTLNEKKQKNELYIIYTHNMESVMFNCMLNAHIIN